MTNTNRMYVFTLQQFLLIIILGTFVWCFCYRCSSFSHTHTPVYAPLRSRCSQSIRNMHAFFIRNGSVRVFVCAWTLIQFIVLIMWTFAQSAHKTTQTLNSFWQEWLFGASFAVYEQCILIRGRKFEIKEKIKRHKQVLLNLSVLSSWKPRQRMHNFSNYYYHRQNENLFTLYANAWKQNKTQSNRKQRLHFSLWTALVRF